MNNEQQIKEAFEAGVKSAKKYVSSCHDQIGFNDEYIIGDLVSYLTSHPPSNVKEEEVERLKDILHMDRSGLAHGLSEIKKAVDGWRWAAEARGPFTYDDATFYKEMGFMLDTVEEIATNTLRDSGHLAHAECCGREKRHTIVETLQERIASLESTPKDSGQQWVSVEAEKPEYWRWLYVAIDTKGAEQYPYFVKEANFYQDGEFFDQYHKAIKNVAYWRYKILPSPPSGEQDKPENEEVH